MTKDEARKALLFAPDVQSVKSEAIDAFERSAVAEALQPRDPAPGLADVEAFIRRLAAEDRGTGALCPDDLAAIADELDRLRGGIRSIRESLDQMLYIEPKGGQHAVRSPRRPLVPSERRELEELRDIARKLGGEP